MEQQHILYMSESITICDVPDETSRQLAIQAAAKGCSLDEYLRDQLVELARRPDPEVLVARLRKLKSATGSRLNAESILGHGAADRR